MSRKRLFNLIVVFALTLSYVSFATPPSTMASRETAPPGSPQALPSTMPVFHILPYAVDDVVVMDNAALLNGVGATEVSMVGNRGMLDNFFALNPDDGNIVNQFDIGGGLFAVNYGNAFGETEMTVDPTPEQICNFLTSRGLFPSDEVEPQFTDCRGAPAYIVSSIHLTTVDPLDEATTDTIVGKLVEVPLAIDIGTLAPEYIPLGGPGGHLSLLFAGAPATPSLDDTLPGLQALSAPLFGRAREATPIGSYPVVPMPLAISRFRAGFPAEMAVDPGTPVMEYYVGYPDMPQDALMPVWTFPDATADIDGTTVALKETTMPGVEGFAPVVSSLNPLDGDVFLPDDPITIDFSVTGDFGPFTFTISSEGGELANGVMDSGANSIDLGPLPNPEGHPSGHILTVHAENTYNQAGEATVFTGPVQTVYLPLTARNASESAMAFGPPLRAAASENPPQGSGPQLGVGIEWVMNYHDPELNLGQTKPDAEGFYNWLGGNGWAKKFNYGNDAAWEKDWRDCTLGGIDCTYGVDRADFVYFSGHGSPSAWYFGKVKDYGGAWAGNARFQNVRWAAFSSCKTVKAGPYIGPGNPPLTEFFNSFQGAYMMLGFNSNMADVAFGFPFALGMRNPIYDIWPSLQPTIAQAWVSTAFNLHAGKPSYLYAVGNLNPVNYKLPGAFSGPLPPLTGIYQFRWVWWG